VFGSQEELRSERERLHREQEALERQRQLMKAAAAYPSAGGVAQPQPAKPAPMTRSLQDVSAAPPALTHRSLQDVSSKPKAPVPLSAQSRLQAAAPRPTGSLAPHNYRLSLPDLQQQADAALRQHQRRAPLPIPPAKPLAALSKERRSVDDPRYVVRPALH